MAPAPKPVIVKTADLASVAVFGDWSGMPPLVHLTETASEPLGLLGTKSVLTMNLADASWTAL